ncbi:hypothetical protein J6590_102208 [Homalodisca vitripennis]|nr:hypothetical protein J6590_102208 [Homalodisca vitripennis]
MNVELAENLVFWGLDLVVTYSSCWYFVSQVSSDWRNSPVAIYQLLTLYKSQGILGPSLSGDVLQLLVLRESALVVTYSSCWYFVSQVSSDWRTSPVVMSVETRATSSWTIPAPAVTVCTSSHISHAKIDYAALSATKNLSSAMKARLEVIHQLCGDIGGEADYLDDNAIKYVINNYLPDLRRVFVSVTRIQENLQPLSDLIQVVITPISICFVHNMLPLNALFRPEYLRVYEHYGLFSAKTAKRSRSSWTPDLGYRSDRPDVTPIRLWGNGFRSSTKYLLSINQMDYDPVCSFGSKALSIYLHNPAEVPWRIHNNVYLGTSFRVVAFVSPIVTSTDDEVKVWNPLKRGCYFENERYLRYFRIYTQRNCERECDSNNTFKHCGCVLINHPRDIIEQEIRHGSSYACKCLPSCNDIDFDTETHWRPWQFKVNSTFASVPAAVDLNSTAVSLMAIAVKKKYLNKTKRTALIGSAAYVG